MYDYVIIGAGIIGTTIARELSKYQLKILVLEKENDIANHQTTANSAIIHSGHDPKPGTLKARLCVRGNALYHTLEKELSIPLLKTGAYVVAHDEAEEEMLLKLRDRAVINGVHDTHLLTGDEARVQEPNLTKKATMVLSLPSTMVTYPWEVAMAALENAIVNGVSFEKNSEVIAIHTVSTDFLITLKSGKQIKTHHIISAAGIYSDHIASMLEQNMPYTIHPRKGEYYVLDRKAKHLFSHVLYPLPTEKGKGVLIVPQVHGNILLGPTSTLVGSKETASTTPQGMAQIREDLKRLADSVPFELIIRSFAGIRASSSYDDFYIQESKEVKGFYHVAGIDSPGLTAAPAIAEYLVQEVLKIKALKKEHFNPIRIKQKAFYSLSLEDRKALIKEDPKYGNIICKCEKITEAEIVAAIHGVTGNDTIKGIKKRARAGGGLCQGGYCENHVLKIIARETGKPLNSINYYAENTPILVAETKVKK
jgi:glycerol-3-phosphate dehydrogenase